jgi:hypothetical protein
LDLQPRFGGMPIRAAIAYLIAFSIAACVYLTVWSSAPVLQSDSGGYLNAAQDLADFHLDQLQSRPPGYPLLLLLTGSSVSPNRWLVIASLGLHFAGIWLLATLLCRAGLSERMLVLFCLILLLPPYVEAAGYVLSENLAEFMLIAAFASVAIWRETEKVVWMVIAGAALGYAALTRPTFQYLAFAFAGCLHMSAVLRLVHGKLPSLMRASAVLLVVSTTLIAAYASENYRRFGHFTASPILGFALSTKTAGVLERLPDEYAQVRAILIKARNEEAASGQFRPGTTSIFTARSELTRVTGLRGADLSSYLVKMNVALIQRAPLNFLDEVIHGFGVYWLPSAGDLANFHSRRAQLLWSLLHFVIIAGFVLTLLLLGGVGSLFVGMHAFVRSLRSLLTLDCIRRLSFQSFTYLVASCMVFYTAIVSSAIGVGDPRYRVPTDALIVFMLFIGVALWREIVSVGATLATTAPTLAIYQAPQSGSAAS